MQNKHVLLVITALLAANAWRLQRKRERGETASYDGDEQPVTETDALLARAMTAAIAASYVYSLLFDD